MKGKGNVQVFVLDHQKYLKTHLNRSSSIESPSPQSPDMIKNPIRASRIDLMKKEVLEENLHDDNPNKQSPKVKFVDLEKKEILGSGKGVIRF